MKIGLIGKKLGMTQVYTDKGSALPVTVIQVAGNQVVQVKTPEKDGYNAVQLGFDDKREKNVTKPLKGHFKKAGVSVKRVLREFRSEGELPGLGTVLGPEVFAVGDVVDVLGTTKGKGFQGVVKRYGFRGQPATHGSMMHRRTGSIGCRLTPGRVWKNQKMPGHEGTDNRTTENLVIVQSRPDDGVILVRGCVPGHINSYVFVRPAIKIKKQVPTKG